MQWVSHPQPMKKLEIQPMLNKPSWSVRCGQFISQFQRPLLIVLLLIVLSGCSKAVSVAPMPAPPANLASNCQALQSPPEPFLDPERLIWETEVVTAYGDCAARHRLTIEAWTKALPK